jgi:hypothetical protein
MLPLVRVGVDKGLAKVVPRAHGIGRSSGRMFMDEKDRLKVGARLKICAAAITLALMLGGTTATAVHAGSPGARAFDYFTFDCPGSGTVTTLNGINDHGDFAGTCYGSGIYGFLVRNGRFTKFHDSATGPVGCQPCTSVSYMNGSDTIAGAYYDNAGVGHGFIRDVAGNFITIDDPGAGTDGAVGAGTFPDGINDRGVVVGSYVDNAGVNHGFTWSHGVFRTLPNPPGTGTAAGQGAIATEESTSGVIVGEYNTRSGAFRGFELTGGHFFTFNACNSGTSGGTAFAGISNNDRTIVGETYCAGATRHGFVLRSGHLTKVTDPHAGTAPSEGTFISALDEDGDYAVGGFFDAHGGQHGMLVDLG